MNITYMSDVYHKSHTIIHVRIASLIVLHSIAHIIQINYKHITMNIYTIKTIGTVAHANFTTLI